MSEFQVNGAEYYQTQVSINRGSEVVFQFNFWV